jgi:hypothetical protein
MRLASIFRLRLRSLLSRGRVERELDEELRYHLDRQIEEGVSAGMSPEEARYAALREIRNIEQRKEECRDMRGLRLLEDLAQDFRYAIRQLGKNRGFACTAIFVLALGICAVLSIFAFVDAALIRPLPYPDPGRLVTVFESIPACRQCNLSYLDYLDWKRLNKVFSSLEVYNDVGFILNTPSGAQQAYGTRVSAGFFRMLGVVPALGRDFHNSEDRPGAPRTVILSNSTWRKRYGGKRDVIGRTVSLDGALYTIIGVLPRDSFRSCRAGGVLDNSRHFRFLREESSLPQS